MTRASPDPDPADIGPAGPVPPLRGDIRLVPQAEGGALLMGAGRSRRVRLDARGAALAALLDRDQTFEDLQRRIAETTGRPMDPEALRRTLLAFRDLGLLQEPTPISTEPSGPDSWQTLPLRLDPRGRFSCLACGSCCHGVNVPFDRDALERLTPDRLEMLQRELHFQNAPVLVLDGGEGDEALPICRNRFGACLFLDGDLCGIHRRFGPEAKPLVCRMFPWDFLVCPDGITVSLQMECRHPQALLEGAPLADQEAEIRELLRLVGPRPIERDRTTLDGSTVVSWSEYLELEQEVLDRMDRTTGGGFEIWASGGEVLRERWRIDPGPSLRPAEAAETFWTLLREITERASALRRSVRHDGAALRVETRHLDGVVEAMATLPRHAPAVFASDEEGDSLRIIRTWARNWWWGRGPLRMGDLLSAQALAMLQWVLTCALAVHGARLVERRFLTLQDRVDAWTRVHFFLRNRRVRDALRPFRPALVSLLVHQLDALREGIRELPVDDPGTDFFLL